MPAGHNRERSPPPNAPRRYPIRRRVRPLTRRRAAQQQQIPETFRHVVTPQRGVTASKGKKATGKNPPTKARDEKIRLSKIIRKRK